MLQYARQNGNKTVFNYTQHVRTYTVKNQIASQPRTQALVFGSQLVWVGGSTC